MFQREKEYRFDSFVTGDSNRFAYTAALEAAKAPGERYNPLVLTSAPGLGKTHLMKAMEAYILENHPGKKVLYMVIDTFVEELIEALRKDMLAEKKNAREEFWKKYSSLDVLFLDDIQFLAGKNRTQAELMAVMEKLCRDGKQVVFSSDVPVEELDEICRNFCSEMEWGLVTDISAPDYGLRLAILEKKLEQHEMDENTRDALRSHLPYIAANVTGNVRQLEGAMNRMFAYCELLGSDGRDLPVEEMLKDMIGNKATRRS